METGEAAPKRFGETLFGVDIRSLALMRMGVGSLLLIDLFQRSRWVSEYYGQRGLVNEGVIAALKEAPFPSIHLLNGSVEFQTALLVLAAGFAGLLLVGCWTRVACVASWYLMLSLHVRNPLILDAGDTLLMLVLFWSMFLPLGATFSLDAKRRSVAASKVVVSAASAALLLQFAVVYFGAGAAKTGPEWVSDGTAILYVMNQTYWTTPLGDWLAGYPDFMRVLTFGTILFEIGAPFLLFSPWATRALRGLMIPAFWIFQHSLGLTIELGIFPWICSIAILPFIPSGFWDRLAPLARNVPGIGALATSPPDPEAPAAKPPTLSKLGNGALLLFVVCVFYSSILVFNPSLVPKPLMRALMVLRIDQNWGVYAPSPGNFDYGFTRDGSLADGATVDLDVRVRGERWRRVVDVHDDYRFKIYVQAINDRDLAVIRRRYARWICDEWNAEVEPSQALHSVRLEAFTQDIVPEGGRGPRIRLPIVDRPCANSVNP